MPITRIRGDLQLASGSVPISTLGAGAVPAANIASDLAGKGLLKNPTTKALDVDVDPSEFHFDADVLELNANVTLAGNTFNAADSLLMLDSLGRIPALDGSQLFGISGNADFIDLETPSGVVDGVNAIFSLAFTPVPGSVHLFYNGILLRPGAGNDFVMFGSTISMNSAPTASSVLLASYRR